MKKITIGVIAVLGGLLVFGIKFISFLISNSVALLSDALESVINIAASSIMLFSIYVSGKPPDESHQYGHQKIEEISRLIEGILIIIISILLLHTAFNRLFSPAELHSLDTAISVSIIAAVVNSGIAYMLLKESKMRYSPAFEGDAKHLFSDVLSSIAIWVGLAIVYFTGYLFIDSLLAIGVAAFITRIGLDLIIKSSNYLMDPASREADKKIREILESHRNLFSEYHELKTRRSGNMIFSELHLVVSDTMTVKEAHDIADHLEEEIKKELPDVNLTIHVEPESERKNLKTTKGYRR
ncbi:MAG: cation diffusion facilitator family transporter [Thaumarchaeota archaeon]|nr:cation diffusion facilitator family transporter [Candidatus Geocrenenecus arthurdayi]MCL7391911.1 cation diffusion facilitator family transporter [Candidatus Geocrenenecus arthurdayi]MCL7397330.1 cation diffusion facilitator family transporter [Candidatus Geocrenenecus arthurdayi]MCL7404309.1 cation diffusion facilitator family transporter [Candidatus Geocrenenecus arthurdayi]